MTLITSNGIAQKIGDRWILPIDPVEERRRQKADLVAALAGMLLVAVYCTNYWSQVPKPY